MATCALWSNSQRWQKARRRAGRRRGPQPGVLGDTGEGPARRRGSTTSIRCEHSPVEGARLAGWRCGRQRTRHRAPDQLPHARSSSTRAWPRRQWVRRWRPRQQSFPPGSPALARAQPRTTLRTSPSTPAGSRTRTTRQSHPSRWGRWPRRSGPSRLRTRRCRRRVFLASVGARRIACLRMTGHADLCQ